MTLSEYLDDWRICQSKFSPNEESELFPDPNYQPSTQGLSELNISGSSDFTILRHYTF